ncbi:four helix bundle protein [bacterium]|nr:four helix bundle protein [bacterium]
MLADKLAHKIYDISFQFPQEEIYGLTSQITRAALSVPTNIVEGYTRISRPELKHFCSITLGSLGETGYLLDFSLKRKYISQTDYTEVKNLHQETGALLWKFYHSLESKIRKEKK